VTAGAAAQEPSAASDNTAADFPQAALAAAGEIDVAEALGAASIAAQGTGQRQRTVPSFVNPLAWTAAEHPRETLTDNWFGAREKLAELGLDVSLSLTQIYQLNLDGGLATHRHAGRYTGTYDLPVSWDLDKALGLKGASIHALAEGGWSDGIDPPSVGSLFNVNSEAVSDRAIYLRELYWQQELLDGKVDFRVGKLDLMGGFEFCDCPSCFDASRFAWDRTRQFINGALAGNPTIPFPDPGLGAIVQVEPVEWAYLAAGVGDADARVGQTGFNTAFHGPANFFSIYEAGFVPTIPWGDQGGKLTGVYRVGFWYDPQDKQRLDGTGLQTDDLGLYASFDQDLVKESMDPNDSQGLGAFFRFGCANDDVNEIDQFWSLGAQYQGAIPGRDDDVVAVGVAQGRLVPAAGFTKEHETAVEAYYNIAITPWLGLSPSVQYICNPGGGREDSANHATVIGVRAQLVF
jgi:porin